jgi:hypothetical protein
LDQYVRDHRAEFFLDEREEDPAEGAQARLNLAYRLVTRNQPGDLDRARPLLERALATAQAAELAGIAGRCDGPCRILEVISSAGFEHYFDEVAAGVGSPEGYQARYGVQVDLDRTRRLCEQHGLVFPIND